MTAPLALGQRCACRPHSRCNSSPGSHMNAPRQSLVLVARAAACRTPSEPAPADPAAAQTAAPLLRRPAQAAAAALAAAALLASSAVPAFASDIPTTYFGSGCYWGRQFDFIQAEQSMGRVNPADISAVVGYAGGGGGAGPDGKVCYYFSDPRTIYEKLGHAEVTQVALSPDSEESAKMFRRFADTYFSQFVPLKSGKMGRQDPQDSGAGYRNVVGLPGGMDSPLFKILQEANVNGMDLRPGIGNMRGSEGDIVNVVWVLDSNKLPFYQAERYHQLHQGLGHFFPASYTRDLRNQLIDAGKLPTTGCPEYPF